MTDRKLLNSEWPLYQEDEISEWYQEYERAVELWIELSNLHNGIRCENLARKHCEICGKVAGNWYAGMKLLGIINEYEVTDGEDDLQVSSDSGDLDAGVTGRRTVSECEDAGWPSDDVVFG